MVGGLLMLVTLVCVDLELIVTGVTWDLGHHQSSVWVCHCWSHSIMSLTGLWSHVSCSGRDQCQQCQQWRRTAEQVPATDNTPHRVTLSGQRLLQCWPLRGCSNQILSSAAELGDTADTALTSVTWDCRQHCHHCPHCHHPPTTTSHTHWSR